ncbi:MAG TPA: exodeoxyribonuclease VII large subunit [bacterium]|nr:exodeoxyribonuclease VII large subunit [bacterium]HOL48463.1 exodeoxyribonuclease VII large subunit [bacterium]HPQ19959.1 exodeoxyribonuclease VII large subunit [bacterium]
MENNNKQKLFTVSELNRLIKEILEVNIYEVYVTGEISNLKYQSSGHIYFSLKDENNSVIRCVIWQYYAKNLDFKLKDGDKINVSGYLDVYITGGYYQIKVIKVEQAGIGKLLLEFEKLKKKLEAEGLFDKKYKKKLPRFPQTIGIITSPTGAAIQDIRRVISSRYPIVKLYLYPVAVQGDNAKFEIVEGIKYFNEKFNVDLIILGRGGGSIEDLWAFNEEIVARAIFASKIPIISAVGHEIDFTISDFVADMRGATPSAAAEIAVPDMKELLKYISSQTELMKRLLLTNLKIKKDLFTRLKNSKFLLNPIKLIEEPMQRLDFQNEYLQKAILNIFNNKKNKFNTLQNAYVLNNLEYQFIKRKERIKNLFEKIKSISAFYFKNYFNKINELNISLKLLSPYNILERGYSIASLKNKIIKNANDLKIDDELTITFFKGKADTKVKKIITKES